MSIWSSSTQMTLLRTSLLHRKSHRYGMIAPFMHMLGGECMHEHVTGARISDIEWFLSGILPIVLCLIEASPCAECLSWYGMFIFSIISYDNDCHNYTALWSMYDPYALWHMLTISKCLGLYLLSHVSSLARDSPLIGYPFMLHVCVYSLKVACTFSTCHVDVMPLTSVVLSGHLHSLIPCVSTTFIWSCDTSDCV